MPTKKVREDLRPGSTKATKLVRMIRDRIDFSYRHISQNFDAWHRAEEHYRIFRPSDKEDRESLEKFGVQKIIVPIQFATLQTMITFMMEVFTAMKPVLKVEGADPASVHPARIMELLLDYDYRGNRGFFTFYQWFLNWGRYGYGVLENTWGTRVVTKQVIRPTRPSKLVLDGEVIEIPGAMELARDYFTVFEGNQWKIVDNREWFFDPRLPLSRFQEGEFCGRRSRSHDNDLRKLEDQDIYFNTSLVGTGMVAGSVSAVVDSGGEGSFPVSGRDRIATPSQAFQSELADAKRSRQHIDEMLIVELIPKQYELSDTEQPEHWLFNLIDGNTIVRAEPNPFYGPFPWSVIESYPDVLASMSLGVMELTEPMAAHLNFLFNSHMANVRKAINDTLLVDPSKVDLRDLLDPKAGKIIRLLPMAYGTDPSMAIRQLAISDITQGHMNDAKIIMDLWNKILGTSEQIFGQVSSGRRTATDVQSALKMSGSRMKMLADLASSEGVAPLTEQMAILRQENTSDAQFLKLAGRSALELGLRPDDVINGFIKIRREHLTGVFNFPSEEGVMPQDRAQAADLLKQTFETVSRSPFLMQMFDPIALFKETIRQYGLHNIGDFINKGPQGQASILPDAQVQDMVGAGQLVPSGAGPGAPNRGATAAQTGMTLAGLVNGSGRAGMPHP